jgi:nucleotide-binding universal stress UspA family protein
MTNLFQSSAGVENELASGYDLIAIARHGRSGIKVWLIGSVAECLLEEKRFMKGQADMFQRILVPLDGSPRAECAIPVAARIARASGGSVLLLRVVTHPIDTAAYFIQPPNKTEHTLDMRHARATDYLTHIASSHELAGVSTTMQVADSIPAQTILSAARLQSVDLIVMCSHGETGFTHWALGSVAQKVTHQSPVPVLVLREKTTSSVSQFQEARPVRIAVGLDGSSLAETVLMPAAYISALLSSPAQGALHLVQVLDFPSIEQTKEQPFKGREQAKTPVQTYLGSVEQRLREGALAHLNLTITSSVIADTDIAITLLHIAEKDDSLQGPRVAQRDVISCEQALGLL